MTLEAEGPNAQQIEYWNGEAGEHWSERDADMDAMLRPLGVTVIDRAAPVEGEQVLDIGCGCGATSLLLAERVGQAGHVLGVDISAPMLSQAQGKLESLEQGERPSIAFEQADAATFAFPPGGFDLLFSRFGVMFFADPAAAFTNMCQALKPGGRLAFLCWGPVEENEWITVPMRAAMAHLPPPEPMDPRDPGPFAFADADYVKEILGSAGFSDIDLEVFTPTLRFGQGRTVAETADFFLDIGPTARALDGQPDSLRNTVKDAIIDSISGRWAGDALELGGRCWIVTARTGEQG
jgi:SAM-dependent methyltransferase